MGVPTDRCLIWEEEYPANVSTDPNSRVMTVYDSPRADGSYKVTYHMVLDDVHRFSYLSQEQKAWLTTWLIEQRQKGNDIPIVTKEIVEYIIAKGPLAVHERPMDAFGSSLGSQKQLHTGFPFSTTHLVLTLGLSRQFGMKLTIT